MRFPRRHWRIPYLLLLLSLIALALAGCRTRSTTTSEQSLLVLPDDSAAPVLALIDGAQASIRFKIYLLTFDEVRQALVRAAGRGVDVRVLIEQNPTGGGESNQESFAMLAQGGVQVRWTPARYRLTHEKSLVIDDRQALVGTFNYTRTSFNGNREYGLRSSDPALVQAVAAVFDADWNDQPYQLPPGSPLVLSPLNSRAAIEGIIDGAASTLWLEQSTLIDDEIAERLAAAARRGVEVRFAGPLRSGEEDFSVANYKLLQEAGAQVRRLSSPLIHAKVILADDSRALIGSINLSASSLNLNRELGVITTHPDVLARLRTVMAADWERAAPLTGTAANVISWQDAGDYIGAEVTVEGVIARTHNTGKVTYLNFTPSYRGTLTIVIFASDAARFAEPPDAFFRNRRVQVRGTVKLYEGAPEIIVSSPDQIRLLDEDAGQLPLSTDVASAESSAESSTESLAVRAQPPTSTPSTTQPPVVAPWQEAGQYIGQEVVIAGKVVRAYDSGKVTYLNFTEAWQGTMSVVIFAADAGKFAAPPATLFLNQEVQVRGQVKEYKGAPEIVVESPEQIVIVGAPSPTAAAQPEPPVSTHGLIPWDQAAAYLGQNITIAGRVVRTYDAGNITFINFTEQRDQFVVVVFADDYGLFPEPPAALYADKQIWVTGVVSDYQGLPQMIVEHPDQIEIFP